MEMVYFIQCYDYYFKNNWNWWLFNWNFFLYLHKCDGTAFTSLMQVKYTLLMDMHRINYIQISITNIDSIKKILFSCCVAYHNITLNDKIKEDFKYEWEVFSLFLEMITLHMHTIVNIKIAVSQKYLFTIFWNQVANP